MRVILRFLLALSLTLAAGYAVLRQGAAIMERDSAEKQDGPRRGRGPGAGRRREGGGGEARGGVDSLGRQGVGGSGSDQGGEDPPGTPDAT